jgi:DNA-binding NarL/FixJ family response regulator
MTMSPDIDELVKRHRAAVTAFRRSRAAALRAAADRRWAVAELRATGLTMPAIAELLGSTAGAVEQILRRHRELSGKGQS